MTSVQNSHGTDLAQALQHMRFPPRNVGSEPSSTLASGRRDQEFRSSEPLNWPGDGGPTRFVNASKLLKFSIITAIPLQSPIPTFWQHSLKSQRHANWEHIVLEYGGTSSKAMWHAGYCPTQVGKPVEPLYSKTEAINKGLSLAVGDIIAFLPLNCVYRNEEVLLKVAERMQDPEVDMVYGDLECVSRGNVRRHVKAGVTGISSNDMLRNGLLPFEECVFVRRDWWQFFGGLETSYQHSAGVARMLDLLAQPGFHVDYMDEVLVRTTRKAETNTTSLSRLLEEVTAFSKRNLLGVYLTHRNLHQRNACD